MRNRWTVEKEPVIGWAARLPADRLLDVLRAGEATGAVRVVEAPSLGYGRTAGVAFTDAVDLPDPLALFRAAHRLASRIAVADEEGTVGEAEVSDLAAVPHAGPATPRAPLRLSAFRAPDGSGRLDLLVSSCSDVWLPWCSARYEEGAHVDDLADNRELARRHTPRLNAFLTRVGELADGELAVFPDDTAPELAFQLDDHGVRLDAENPRERTVWERFGAGRDLLDALRDAAAQVARQPPPAPYRAAVGVWTDSPSHPLYDADRAAVLDAVRGRLRPAETAGLARVTVRTGAAQHDFDVAEITT